MEKRFTYPKTIEKTEQKWIWRNPKTGEIVEEGTEGAIRYRRFWGYVSTEAVDFYDTIVEAKAVRDAWDAYSGNVRYMHQPEPVGKIFPGDYEFRTDGVYAGVSIPETEETVIKKIDSGLINAFSLGFWPVEVDWGEDDDDIIRIKKIRIAEITICDAGATPRTDIQEERSKDKNTGNTISLFKRFMNWLKSERTAVSYKKYPTLPEDTKWDGNAARKRLQKWASSDGSGDKDKIDWSKYKLGFAIVRGDGENLGDYLLPHHDVVDNAIKTNYRGCVAALQRLDQVKDVSDADKEKARSHLEKHIKDDFGKTVEKSTNMEGETMFTEEQFKEFMDSMKERDKEILDTLKTVVERISAPAEEPPEKKETPPDPDPIKKIEERLAAIERALTPVETIPEEGQTALQEFIKKLEEIQNPENDNAEQKRVPFAFGLIRDKNTGRVIDNPEMFM